MPLFTPSAPIDATYITQLANGILTADQNLAALATGLLKNATGTGVLSIGAQGTDYYAPGGTDVAIVDGGTGQSTAQLGINALTNVAGATNEHVLTKDTVSGNAIFKAAAGAGDIWVEKAGDTMTGLLTYVEPADAATHKIYAIDPIDPDAKLFNWNIATSVQAGRDNVVINWGYNQAAGGGPEDNTDATFYQQLETDYPSGGGNRRMEYHWDFFVAGGADPGIRPMHMNLDKNTGLIDIQWFTDTFTWSSARDGQFGLMGLNSGATALLSELRVYVPSSFEQELHFSGTTHAGLRLNSLTTVQKNALTPAVGMLLYDTTLGRMQGYIGAAWATLYSAGGTDVAIADGGTGQSTAQAAIDALTNVAAATNEYVLTKDTATGNAIFKAGASGGSVAGSDTQIQFNDSGAFGADADLTWNKTANLLTLTGKQTITGATASNILLTLKTTDNNVTNPALRVLSSADAVIASIGATGLINTVTHYQINSLRALHFTAGGTFVGSQAGNLTTTGAENTGVGNGALLMVTSGENNVGIGSLTLADLTTGFDNVAIGRRVLQSFNGNNTIAIGTSALASITSGAQSVAIGVQALQSIVTASNSTAVGYAALKNVTGANNTALGNNTGIGLITGERCTFLGVAADATSSGIVSSIALGYAAKVAASYTMVIGSDNLGGDFPINQIIQNIVTEGNAVQDAYIFNGESYNTPAAGHGVAIVAKLRSSTTIERLAGRLSWRWPNTAGVTDATRASQGRLTSYYTSTERESIRWGSNSSNPLLGFLDAEAIPRQTVAADATDLATAIALVNDIKAKLSAAAGGFGLFT